MLVTAVFGLILCAFVSVVWSANGAWCNSNTIWCDNGCCGSYSCCVVQEEDDEEYGIDGLVLGVIIGCVVLTVLGIGGIVFSHWYKHRKMRRLMMNGGQVPSRPGPGISTVSSTADLIFKGRLQASPGLNVLIVGRVLVVVLQVGLLGIGFYIWCRHRKMRRMMNGGKVLLGRLGMTTASATAFGTAAPTFTTNSTTLGSMNSPSTRLSSQQPGGTLPEYYQQSFGFQQQGQTQPSTSWNPQYGGFGQQNPNGQPQHVAGNQVLPSPVYQQY